MRASVLIDGGFLRAQARRAGCHFDPDFVDAFAKNWDAEETRHRILYYDCAPFSGTVRLPVSNTSSRLAGDDAWLTDLSHRELFAVRKGLLKFRGFVPKQVPLATSGALRDEDFKPVFAQKGVDMRLGLDIALYSDSKTIDRIILVSNDTDCVPALKYARRAGLQVATVKLPASNVHAELRAHSDFVRPVAWPQPAAVQSP